MKTCAHRVFKCIIAAALAALCVLAGCAPQGEAEPQRTVTQVNPQQEAAAADSTLVRLYFGYLDEEWLCGEAREIDIPVNGRIETSVVRALIDGPLAISPELTGLISPDTQVVDVSDSGEYLFVTLSDDFLSYPSVDGLEPGGDEYAAAMSTRRLAVKSIVNTLVELGTYSRIQVLVDTTGTGRGQRITAAEAGFEGEGTLEPLMRDAQVIRDAGKAALEFLRACAEKNWEGAYAMVAQWDGRGDRPDYEAFAAQAGSIGVGIEEYQTVDAAYAPDGESAVVMVSYTCVQGDGQSYRRENVPIPMVLENSVWKTVYAVLTQLE